MLKKNPTWKKNPHGFYLQRKTLLGLGWKEWTFLIVSTLNILITIGLTIDRLVIVTENDETSSSDFTFAILILVNACKYAVVLVLHEIFSCNSNSHMRGVSTERILERKSLNFSRLQYSKILWC